MNQKQAEALIGTQRRAFWGNRRELTRIAGEVVAVSTKPMVCIRRDDGVTEWWTADLTEAL